jgi:hypothetical protein
MLVDIEESTSELLSVYSEILGLEMIAEVEHTGCKSESRPDSCRCESDSACADILLVNQATSGTSGFDLIRERIDRDCKVPIRNTAILSTGLSSAEFMQARELGCHCLKKPISYEIFENWIGQIKSRDVMRAKARFN